MVLPIPAFFNRDRVGEVWSVPYEERAHQARDWAQRHGIRPANQDSIRTGLLIIDAQNTFCIPGFELFVGGRSGTGAVDDNRRLCEFIYTHLDQISEIIPTLDTHTSLQIFHAAFWQDAAGQPPVPMTMISWDDVVQGKWRVNEAIAPRLGVSPQGLQDYALHYTHQLAIAGKFPLTIWPYHSILGGIGHALVSAVEEACFFHGQARQTQPRIELKGSHPLTENYSVLRPEVSENGQGDAIASPNTALIEHLLSFDRLWIAGQAKSHCVAWTIDDLLTEIQHRDANLAQKIYLLDDCTSPVVVPGIIDFTDSAEAAFERYAAAGMHRLSSITEVSA